jgi:prepilin peptidase CpaA
MVTYTIIVFCVVLIALITDLRERRIPNLLTFGGAIVGLIVHTFDSGWDGLTAGLIGWVVGIALLIIPFLMGGMGAGDVKLMGAIGALMGAPFVFFTMLWTGVAGGIISIIYLLYHRTWFSLSFRKITASSQSIPYGIAIFIGVVAEITRVFMQ